MLLLEVDVVWVKRLVMCRRLVLLVDFLHSGAFVTFSGFLVTLMVGEVFR